MPKRTISIFVLIAAILAVVSCRKDPLAEDGFGGIILSLNSKHALRMETKGTLLDGSLFNNVLVILTDDSGIIVGKVYRDHTGDPKDEDLIEFRALLPGNYHAYAYANIDAEQWQNGSALISSQEYTAPTSTSFSDYLNRELLALTQAGTDTPTSPSEAMLLTGKVDISVGLSVAERTIDLLRPVVRFKVTIHNNTPFPVTVNSLNFSNFNPDKAYLLDHRDASGVPTVPDGVTYRELPAFVPSSSSTVAAGREEIVYSTYLYENAAPDAYKLFTSVSLDRSSEDLEELFIPGFGVIDYNALNSLEENESLNVLVINPRSAVRSGRLYYGIGDSGLAWESCGYANFSDMMARAKAIYNQVDNHFEYKNYSYNGWQNNKSGYAGWTGNSGDNPVPTANGKYYYDYTNARGSYFKTITKYKDGDNIRYRIDGLAECPIQSGDSSIDGLQLDYGLKPGAANRYPTGLDVKDLVRFKLHDNVYLASNNAYYATTDEEAKECKLEFLDYNSGDEGSKSNYQFVLIGQQKITGHPLKRILKENNKEVPLTYMARNEEINVIINVFYSNQQGTLKFEVDNSHWTEDDATISLHTFN